MNIYLHIFDPDHRRKLWVRAGDSEDAIEARITSARAAEREVILTRIDGSVCAADAQCPHREGSLARGTVIDGNIRCPVHGYEFDARTGRGIGNDLVLEMLRVVESDAPPPDRS